jgi:MSHA pilin protein MshD
MYTSDEQRGTSLIELIMFIVIVAVALAGILLVMNTVTRSSADPMIHKQALAIAESLLEEIELMPFTLCDPDDGSAASAVVAADCGTVAPVVGAENLGTENDVSRYDPNFPFDNVSDYNGFNMAAGSILDITGANTGLNGYTLEPIVVTLVAPGVLPGVAANDALLITVTVRGPDGTPIVVDGIRTRYSPNP